MQRFTRFARLAAVSLVLGACASSETGPVTRELDDGSPAQNVRECRYAKTTGTKMRYRMCKSQAEWAAIDAVDAQGQDSSEFFRRALENATLGAGGVSAPGN